MHDFLRKLKEKKLVQWTLAYLGGSWLLLQIVGLFAEQLGWPPIVFKSASVLLGVGFPGMLVLAWYHGEKGRQRVGGVELLMLGALLILAAAALTLVRGRSPAADPTAARADAATEPGSLTSRVGSFATRRLTATPGLEAHPTWSPDDQSIAYLSVQSGNRDLWVHSLSGGRDTQITSDSADDVQPAWSPDGRRIAFTSSRDHGPRLDQSVQFGYSLGGGIWTVPATGGTPTRMVDGGFNPSWSPDGRLVFDSSLDGARRIWTASGDGSDPIRISTDRSDGAVHTRPKWSPDRRWIVYERQEGSLTTSSDIQLVPAAGGTAMEVVADGQRNLAPTWANDSTLIFVSDRAGALNLWAVTINPSTGARSGEPERLTASVDNDVDPSVSRSGDAIAYSARRIIQDLWTVAMDPATGEAVGEPAPLLTSSWSDVAPAQSGAGVLVMASNRGDGPLKLWRLDDPDASPVAITGGAGRDMQPDWAPDGQRIAFFSDRSGNNDIWVVPSEGGTAVKLTKDPADDSNPYWSPDGSRLAFMSDRGGSQQIWVMDADGSDPRRLTMSASGRTPPAGRPTASGFCSPRSTMGNGTSGWRAPPMAIPDASPMNRDRTRTPYGRRTGPSCSFWRTTGS